MEKFVTSLFIYGFQMPYILSEYDFQSNQFLLCHRIGKVINKLSFKGTYLVFIFLWFAALNEKLKEEVQRLRIQAGQVSAMNGNPFNRGLSPQYLTHQPAPHHFGVLQTPQQQQQQQQLQMPHSSTNNPTLNGQPQPRFMDFN